MVVIRPSRGISRIIDRPTESGATWPSRWFSVARNSTVSLAHARGEEAVHPADRGSPETDGTRDAFPLTCLFSRRLSVPPTADHRIRGQDTRDCFADPGSAILRCISAFTL